MDELPIQDFLLFYLLCFDVSTKLQADSLPDVLSQFCDGVDEQIGHGFSNFSSPVLQFSDNPFISGMNLEFHIGSNPFDNNDYLNEYLNSVLESDDCSSGACIFPKDSHADSLAKDSASCKDSGSNSEIEIEPCLPQVAFIIVQSTTKNKLCVSFLICFSPSNLGCYFPVVSWGISWAE